MFFERREQKVFSGVELVKLIAFAWPDFLESKSGLVFILDKTNCSTKNIKTRSKNLYFEKAWPLYYDRTAYESTINHMHLEFVFPAIHKNHLEKIALKIGEMWMAKLKLDFPDKHFRLYLTDKTVFRLHQIHPKEGPWLKEEDFPKLVAKGELVVWEW